MAQNKVTKCICHDKSFVEVRKYAEEHEFSSVTELQDDNFCSNSCGLCEPYVEIVLQTGQIEFSPGEPFRKSKK